MLFVLLPTRSQPHPLTAQRLGRLSIPHKVLTVQGLPIVQARNTLARMVLEVAEDDDSALWLDDDVYFEPETIQQLLSTLDDPNHVIMANVPLRRPNEPPAAFLEYRQRIPPDTTGLVECEIVGFLCTAMKVGLLRRLGPDPFTVLPDQVLEDFSCCERLRITGAKLFVNMDVRVGHIDGRNDHIYYSFRPPMKLAGGELGLETDKAGNAPQN